MPAVRHTRLPGPTLHAPAARAPIRIAFLEDAAVQNATLDLASDMPSRSPCESSRAGSEIWSLASPASPTATSPPSPSSSMYAMQSPIKSSVPLSGKPSRPRKSTAQPGYIKRPHNAFFVFKGSMKDKIRRKKDESGKHINVCAAIIWNGMSDAEKLPFKEQARMLKAEHFQKYPDYKYQPRKKRSTVDTDDEASGSCLLEIPCEDEKKASFMTLTFPLEAVNQPDLVPDASTATFMPSVIADNRFPYAIGINWDPSIASGHTCASENPYSLFRPHGFMCTSFPLKVVPNGGTEFAPTNLGFCTNVAPNTCNFDVGFDLSSLDLALPLTSLDRPAPGFTFDPIDEIGQNQWNQQALAHHTDSLF